MSDRWPVKTMVALGLFAILCATVAITARSKAKDASAYYYGARCLFHGRNPYDNDTILSEWAKDGSPKGFRPGLPNFMFLTLPSQAILIAPAVPFPWYIARYVINVTDTAAFLLAAYLLTLVPAAPWDRKTRTIYWLALPWATLTGLLYLGQVSGYTCLMLAAMLVLLRRKCETGAGVFLALSLSKFTLAIPFLALALYRRYWRAAFVGLAIFAVVNLLFVLPIGPRTALHDYQALVRYSTEPDHVNDAGNRHRFAPDTIIQAKRFFFMVLHWNRPLAEKVNAAFVLLSIGVMAFVLRPKRGAPPAFEHPLEVGIAAAAALTLFYHRHPDLTELMFVVYALLDYRNRWPDRQPGTWKAALGVTLVAAYAQNVYSHLPLIPSIIRHFTGMTSLGPLAVLAVFLLLLWMLAYDQRRYGSAVASERVGKVIEMA